MESDSLRGRYVTVERLSTQRHADDLWNATGGEQHAELWKWMGDGPYPDRAAFDESLRAKQASIDPRFFAVLDSATGRAEGLVSFLREDTKNRVIEVGSIVYGPRLQRTRGATEAMYLMARCVFEEMRYRRYEWKCNAMNEPSRRAALRLGFTFEGVFRQHMIVKGKNRDTAWFSMLDSEWPARKARFEGWLEPSNFDDNGRQRSPLNS